MDRGPGFTGPVRLLHGIHMELQEVRTQVTTGGGLVGLPVVSFVPSPERNGLLVTCASGDAPGAYEVRIQAPRVGGCYQAQVVRPGDARRLANSVELAYDPGTWEARLVAGGSGLAIAEVMGYQAWNLELG